MNMKKSLICFLAAISLTVIFSGCSNVAENNDGGTASQSSVNAPGWYMYKTTVNNVTQTYYFYFNADGSVSRAGNETKEYTGSQLSSVKSTMNYRTCYNSQGNGTTLTFNKKPSWAGTSGSGGSGGGGTWSITKYTPVEFRQYVPNVVSYDKYLTITSSMLNPFYSTDVNDWTFKNVNENDEDETDITFDGYKITSWTGSYPTYVQAVNKAAPAIKYVLIKISN